MNPLTSAAQAIQQIAPPDYGVSPLQTVSNAGQFANLGNLSGLAATSQMKSSIGNALGNLSNQQVSNEQNAAQIEAARQQAQQDLQDKLSDPKNYQKIINSSGGYDFYAPDGTKISPLDYAKATNSRITDVLKDSDDQTDKDFTQDWDFVQQLGQLLKNPGPDDKDGKNNLDKFWDKNPGAKATYQDESYNDIISSLKEEYPQYFQFQNLDTSDVNNSDTQNHSDTYISGKTLLTDGSGGRNFASRAFNALNPFDKNTFNSYYINNKTGR